MWSNVVAIEIRGLVKHDDDHPHYIQNTISDNSDSPTTEGNAIAESIQRVENASRIKILVFPWKVDRFLQRNNAALDIWRSMRWKFRFTIANKVWIFKPKNLD